MWWEYAMVAMQSNACPEENRERTVEQHSLGLRSRRKTEDAGVLNRTRGQHHTGIGLLLTPKSEILSPSSIACGSCIPNRHLRQGVEAEGSQADMIAIGGRVISNLAAGVSPCMHPVVLSRGWSRADSWNVHWNMNVTVVKTLYSSE